MPKAAADTSLALASDVGGQAMDMVEPAACCQALAPHLEMVAAVAAALLRCVWLWLLLQSANLDEGKTNGSMAYYFFPL